jgi:hypothetical protein
MELELKNETVSKDNPMKNWLVDYVGNKLKGFIQGISTNKYPLLNKPLSEYTIGEVQQFQDHARDSTGQLWATGRYQIIPSTLDGLVASLGLSKTQKYDHDNKNYATKKDYTS